MAGKKSEDRVISLQIMAGKATPAPPVGVILGPTGIDMAKFCKEFNDRTKELASTGFKLTVVLTINKKREYKFVVKTPLASGLILKAAGIKKGSQLPPQRAGKITMAQVEEIAKEKLPDLNTNDIEAAIRTIAGTARSMGIEVEA